MDNPVIDLELAGEVVRLHFVLEPCGSIEDRGHLYHFVCEACRNENPRLRDEWVSKTTFIDEPAEDMLERMRKAIGEMQDHARAHEIIGAWAAKILRPAPTADRVDVLEQENWKPV
jgi:hypothetical protein